MTTKDPVLPWYEDLSSCLQTDIGHVLELRGWDPVQALGAGWRFRPPGGPVDPVEFFHPAGEDLQEEFCLYHPVRLTWNQPSDPETAHNDLVEALARGPVIVAVNNFHMPFRPAYQDVHAAHLVIVTGWNKGRGLYDVVDPMPPAFSGALPRSVLEKAREDLSVEDESDPFFAGSRPSWRWLEVTTTGPQPLADGSWVDDAVRRNIAALEAPGRGPRALAELLSGLPELVKSRGPRALREIYILGWPAQAEAALHSTFLSQAANRLRRPDLADAADAVGRVAHAWTGFRVSAAHGATAQEPDQGRAVTLTTTLGERLLLTWDQSMYRLRRTTGTAP